MGMVSRFLLFAALLLFIGGPATFAQQAADTFKVKQIIGLTGVKSDARGLLSVNNGKLHLVKCKGKTDLDAAKIENVVTGNDSQRVIRGSLQLLSMAAPYGGGRFLSLFRSKIDTLTIEYRDEGGGLHGAIFTLDAGKSDECKRKLLQEGAHTTIPLEKSAGDSGAGATVAKEKKP